MRKRIAKFTIMFDAVKYCTIKFTRLNCDRIAEKLYRVVRLVYRIYGIP